MNQKMITKKQIESVDKICDEIGYSNLMSITSALWRKKMRLGGFDPLAALIPTNIDFISPEKTGTTIISMEEFDKIVK